MAQPPSPLGDVAQPPASFGDIVRRQWGQVCRDLGDPPRLVQVSQLLDTLGLRAELDANSLSTSQGEDEEPFVDFLTGYGVDGGVTAQGLWSFSGDSVAAERVGAILGRRVQVLPRLLQAERFRTRLLWYPTPHVEVAPSVECMPHLVVNERGLPRGLPDTVFAWNGNSFPFGAGNDSTVAVRIIVDDQGRVTDMARQRGSQRAFEAALPVIGQLEFDPSLRNGEPIVDSLGLIFRFSRTEGEYADATLDSLWLAARGFFRRAEDFPAVGRLLCRGALHGRGPAVAHIAAAVARNQLVREA